jgi:hypothetical protein
LGMEESTAVSEILGIHTALAVCVKSNITTVRLKVFLLATISRIVQRIF